MYTQCPKCSTIFRVQEEQVTRHKGLVRCGTCRETFNAAWNEVTDLAAARARTAAHRPATPRAEPPPLAAPAAPAKVSARLWKPLPPLTPPAPVARAQAPPEPRFEIESEAIPAQDAPAPLRFPASDVEAEPVLPPVAAGPMTEIPSPPDYTQLRLPDPDLDEKTLVPAPSAAASAQEEPDTVEEIVLESRDNFWEKADQHAAPGKTGPGTRPRDLEIHGAHAPAEAPARRQRALAWTASALLLLAIAIWQIGFFYFDAFAQSPAARPVLDAVCAVLRCRVPERRQLSRIDVAGATVAHHEEIPGALKISVNLVNRAPFPQAEPTLQVTLTDKDAKVVGRRAYPAAQYRRARAALAPNVITLATLELAAPPENAVGYEIELFD